MSDTAATALVAQRARELIAARDGAAVVATITSRDPSFTMADGYAVADEARRLRVARGERPLGYKIGFTNRGIWARYGVFEPIWGPVWDTTVERADDARATVSLARFAAPRLEPEVMFGFARTPSAGASLQALFDCIEWVAHGFEIVDTHFADWRFAAADTVADFALHGRLFVGPRVAATRFDRARVAAELAAIEVVLSCDGREVDSGRADIVLDGPLHALKLWVDAMAAQPVRWPIVAGDIVSTGTITDAAPLHPGERWKTRLSDARFVPMTIVTAE